MKILIIAYKSDLIDQYSSILANEKYKIRTIYLYISSEHNANLGPAAESTHINLLNFHDITIEIMEYQPTLIIYFPLTVNKFSRLDKLEILMLVHIEFIEHLVETIKVINSNLIIIDLLNGESGTLGEYEVNNDNTNMKTILTSRDELITNNNRIKNFILYSKNGNMLSQLKDILDKYA